jgi:3-oxoacyl-[acyl-carrier protein] reductase
MTEFTGKTAIVTGATRGIGRAITQALLEQGATVIGLYAGNRTAAGQMQLDCQEAGDRLVLEQVDVSDHQAVCALFDRLAARVPRIDILISNAGIRQDAVLPLMKEEQWQQVIDVNLTGSYHMVRQTIPLMLAQKYGRIIFITSPMGKYGSVGQANYAASKAGQVGLMKSVAKEVAKRKITVNAVSPGFIDTEFIGDLGDEQLKAYKKMVPMRRLGTAREVADAVLFLAGDRASYITGTVLDISGGL